MAYPKGRPNPRRTPKAAPAPPLATLRYGAARAAGGLPEGPPPPPGPQRRRRGHPSPPCATARRGRPEAYPKGRPYCQKSDPAPPEIGRGSKRALTHPPESRPASCEAVGEPRAAAVPRPAPAWHRRARHRREPQQPWQQPQQPPGVAGVDVCSSGHGLASASAPAGVCGIRMSTGSVAAVAWQQ